MDCPNCGVYNPEERTVCWRCDQPLPKKVEKKKKLQLTSQHWLYIIIAVSVLLMLANMCGVPGVSSQQQPPAGALFLLPWLAA